MSILIFLNDDFVPVARDDATLAKVIGDEEVYFVAVDDNFELPKGAVVMTPRNDEE